MHALKKGIRDCSWLTKAAVQPVKYVACKFRRCRDHNQMAGVVRDNGHGEARCLQMSQLLLNLQYLRVDHNDGHCNSDMSGITQDVARRMHAFVWGGEDEIALNLSDVVAFLNFDPRKFQIALEAAESNLRYTGFLNRRKILVPQVFGAVYLSCGLTPKQMMEGSVKKKDAGPQPICLKGWGNMGCQTGRPLARPPAPQATQTSSSDPEDQIPACATPPPSSERPQQQAMCQRAQQQMPRASPSPQMARASPSPQIARTSSFASPIMQQMPVILPVMQQMPFASPVMQQMPFASVFPLPLAASASFRCRLRFRYRMREEKKFRFCYNVTIGYGKGNCSNGREKPWRI
jgi:hypothetical protein